MREHRVNNWYKISADAGREKFCRTLTEAGLSPVFMPSMHCDRWGYAVPPEDLAAAVNALLEAGITVLGKQKMSTNQTDGKLKKG